MSTSTEPINAENALAGESAAAQLLEKLVDFEPTTFPVLSVYLNMQPDQHGRTPDLRPYLEREFKSLAHTWQFCAEALRRTLRRGRPEIFNSDQGSQFTSEKFAGELAERQVAISMDGRGRCMDNIFVERLRRSLKYEEVYLKDYATVTEARAGIAGYFRFYNHERLHQSLDYRTPAAIYLA